jgi:NitT/TauT family transport system substrate-binding protein
MITTQDMIKNNPAKIQALVSAHIQATQYLLENTESWLEKSAGFGNDPDVLRFSFDNIELRHTIDQTYIEQAKVLAQKMYDLDLIANLPDVEAMFNLDFLNGLHN